MAWEWEFTCPHCGVYVQVANTGQYVDEHNNSIYYSLGRCQRCKEIIYLKGLLPKWS